MADLLVKLGAPRSALILETKSRTTRGNAVNTATILREHDWRSGLLVTSGAHMPRALAAFQKVGLGVVPAVMEILLDRSNLIVFSTFYLMLVHSSGPRRRSRR